jgi:hypothetical protein
MALTKDSKQTARARAQRDPDFRALPKRKARRQLLEGARASGAAKAKAGPSAARSQDFLYDKKGLSR